MIFKRKRGIILTAWKKVITILFQKDYKVRGGFLMRKRIMAAAVLMAVLVVTALAPCTAFGMEFSDVPITASYYKAVDKLSICVMTDCSLSVLTLGYRHFTILNKSASAMLL